MLSGFFQLEQHFGWPIVLAGANTAVVVDWAESILSVKTEQCKRVGETTKFPVAVSHCCRPVQRSAETFDNI